MDNLARLRARGQRPDYPVVVGDNWSAKAWADRNRFFYVSRDEIAEDFTPFTGLHVWFRTTKNFSQVREFCQALAMEAASVTIVDTNKRERPEVLVAA